ncbi:histone deacetylase family protein [Paucibacter sp. R3-3]|uniref:Histone deacetylase family protein n=1 Tax=Roseateles agri TaxID=3098619 RepID=A0ABU5DPX5_9BURK|nr:histone deacetylase family protein [Paucibacter sp. R3-3]MDY0748369.1 histone deacetylase family protein [Paucibacter sp. R3-3]
MLIFHNPQHQRHAGRQEMFRGRLVDCHEVPARQEHVFEALKRRGIGTLQEPGAPDMALLRRIHAPHYLDFLARAWDDWIALDPANEAVDVLPSVWPGKGLRYDVEPLNFSAQVGRYAFDAGTPLTAGTWAAALAGAACATDAARAVASGEARSAMALTRPPGHHAGADFYGGYCFLNNSALAAQALRDAGAARVAVLDVDYHHGNGTQSIFYERGDVFTASLHGDPRTEYPFYLGYADELGSGAGLGANLNLPLPAGTDFDTWLQALDEAIAAVRRHGAEALVVALGVDTFEGDPISKFKLRAEDYPRVGERIAGLGLPTIFVMEGGYAVAALGENVAGVLEGYLAG